MQKQVGNLYPLMFNWEWVFIEFDADFTRGKIDIGPDMKKVQILQAF